MLSSNKKKPFLSDKKFFVRHGFQVVDKLEGDYELLALSFDGSLPRFADNARQMRIDSQDLTIYYSPQCPYIPDCMAQVQELCALKGLPLHLVPVESAPQAKALPCPFNNWAVFHRGKLQTLHLLNATYLEKMLQEQAE